LRVAPVALVVSSVSSRAVRQARQGVVSRRDEPSGIWAYVNVNGARDLHRVLGHRGRAECGPVPVSRLRCLVCGELGS